MLVKKFLLIFEIVLLFFIDLNVIYLYVICVFKLNIFYIYYVKYIVKVILNVLFVLIVIK